MCSPQYKTCHSSFLKHRTGCFYAHEQSFPKIQPRVPARAPQCSSFLKNRTGWFMRMRRLFLKTNHVAEFAQHNPNLSQFFPEIKNRMLYAHAQTFPLSNHVIFYAHAREQTCSRIQPTWPTQFIDHIVRVMYSVTCTYNKNLVTVS